MLGSSHNLKHIWETLYGQSVCWSAKISAINDWKVLKLITKKFIALVSGLGLVIQENE